MFKLSVAIDQIPRDYIDDYVAQQIEITKSRVWLFCRLSVILYVLTTLISLIIFPESCSPIEIPVIGSLILGAFFIRYLNNRTCTLRGAKFNGYLFTLLALLILARVCVAYGDQVEFSGVIYLFVLFVVSFTIPWKPVEVIPLAVMHIGVYSMIFWYSQRYMPAFVKSVFDLEVFYSGLILLFMAFIFCLIMRKKENERDIENFVLLKENERKNEQMKRELELASRIHKTLVPKSLSNDLVDVAVMYLPVEYIGGDYAKFHFIDEKSLICFICDVTGHGVSAALLVNRLHTEFERIAKKGSEPGGLLKKMNDFIIRDFEGTNMYLTAFCCLIDFENMKIKYSSYGHPAQYLYRLSGGSIQGMPSLSGMMGVPFGDNAVYQQSVDVAKGDRILLFTDGIIETRKKDGTEYGRERLEAFIEKDHALQVDVFNRALIQDLTGFKDEDFADDIFILNIQVK